MTTEESAEKIKCPRCGYLFKHKEVKQYEQTQL